MQLLRHGEHHVEMRTIRQPPANLVRPLRLARSEAVRTVAVAARTGIPLLMAAVLATRMIVTQRPLAAEGHQVERRILLLAQSSGPEVAPLAQNTVDGRFDAAYLNSMSAVAQDFRYPLTFLNCFYRRFRPTLRCSYVVKEGCKLEKRYRLRSFTIGRNALLDLFIPAGGLRIGTDSPRIGRT